MQFLAPAALALSLLAVPIVLLYMLRQKRSDRLVSSTLLWRELVRDRTANAPWQRLRRNLLLILQLLILAFLVLALARPALQLGGQVSGNLIVLLDASASMSATDGPGGSTRFQEGVSQVDRLIAGVGGGDAMTLIAVGGAPTVLSAASKDRNLLRAALNTSAPEHKAADWPAALALAGGLAQSMADPRIVIVSDGGLPEGLPAVAAAVSFLPVGHSGENMALATLGVRPTGERLSTLVNVRNEGPSDGQALISLYADGTLTDSRQVDVPAGESTTLTWELPATLQTIEARLEPMAGTPDYLEIDNRAWHVVESTGTQRVWLASNGNLFLERLLAILPGYEIVRVPGGEDGSTMPDEGEFAFYVFDGVPLPPTLPEGNLLIINPQTAETSESFIQVTGHFTDTHSIVQTDDPLLRDVDWRSVNVAEAQNVTAPGLVPLINAAGGPLLLAGEVDGRRVVVLPFDLSRSDLPLQIAFPAIMANIAEWLNPGRAFTMDETPQPGSVVSLIPDAHSASIRVIKPDGEIEQLTPDDATETVLFTDTSQPGLYLVSSQDSDGGERSLGQFAINFNHPDESRIQPASTIRLGEIAVASGEGQANGVREIGPWLLGAGLIVLLVEWWVAYHRRARALATRTQ